MFDINDQDVIGKSFNIFVDTELSELNQIIQIAGLGELGMKKKKNSFSRSYTAAKKSNSALIDLPGSKKKNTLGYRSPQQPRRKSGGLSLSNSQTYSFRPVKKV